MLDPGVAARLRAALISFGGGYLRNPIWQNGVTCADCATPVDGYARCYVCNGRRGQAGLAEAIAFLTYAVAGQQSGYAMRGYKAQPPSSEHQRVVGLLLLLALREHTACAGVLAGGLSVTHWAVVPSLPARPGDHPLRSLITSHVQGAEAWLRAAVAVQRPREISRTHFSAVGLPRGAHVLLVDDTWASGGHAQSAALAVREAGAARVSVLVVARWLKHDFAHNETFVRELASREYDPLLCPWTRGQCP
jgi:hypothetical protein